MKKVLLVLVLTLTITTQAQIAMDKKLHFFAGFVIGATANSITYKATNNEKTAFIVGMGLSFGAGLAKEIRDEIVYGGFDSMDLLYTTLGGLSINVPTYAITSLVKKRRINREL
tara:strand:- start:35 stop:376 length:342 start_codon:yes stop_codon:yes gene_type:complete